MGKYLIKLSGRATKDLQLIKRSGRKSDIKKISKFFREIKDDPKSGSGMPEHLKYFDGEVWSRRINKKDRLVYEIYEAETHVVVIQALGHYQDR